jgi:uncharacterized damage-inducible protein DinB
MTVQDLERRFDYSYWANSQFLAVIFQLTPEQFTQNVAGSYGSIRNTLVHMLSAEWGWLDRCGGHPRGPALKAGDFPTLESVVTTWSTVEQHVRSFLSNLKDDDLGRVVEYSLPNVGTRAGRLGDLLEHAVTHGVHHRGQIALLLRVLGCTPGNVDVLFYDTVKSGAPA